MEKNKGLFSFRKHPVGDFPDGKKERKRKMHSANARKMRRALGMLLAAALIFNTLPASGLAVSASEQETGLCEHHTEHTAECGYAEAQPCTHEHTEECYKTVTECVHEHTDECYPETGETEESTGEGNAATSDAGNREPSLCTHVCKSSEAGLEESGCITKVLDCHHEHDESCGYQEAQECGYVCDICNGTEPEDTGENTENTKDAGMDMAECICKVLCTEDSINGDCPVCGAGGDSLLDCKGKVSEENTEEQEDTGICKHHQEHDADCGYIAKSEDGEGSPCTYECRICPVEDLIAALPNEVTEDNRDEVEAQLREILTLYGNLTEEEQEQTDISRCLALRDQLDALDGQPGEHEAALAAEMTGVKYLNESGEEETCPSATVVETSTTWKSGWYVVSGTVTLSGRVYISGDVHLILADGCRLDASSGGISVNSGKSLTIYAQSTGGSMGELTAVATSNGYAGIGGDSGSCGTITVNGGKITATGGGGTNTAAGSGIGCGYYGSAATITINGGEVTATGGSSPLRGGAGIGATHPDASGVVITINGGTVNATGGSSTNNYAGGSGIGIGADSYYGGTVTVNGGTINAAGGSGSPAGAALCAGKSQVEYWGGTVNDTEYHSYYVTFNPSNVPDGVTFAPPQQRVRSDELVTRPPEVDGWTVTWHEDSSGGAVFDFTQPVSQDTTLYAVWEKNTNYVAEVAIGGSTVSYTTLNAAWASLKSQTGTITLLREVDTNGTTLVVESGMDVTVEMSAGVTLTNSTADCFQVKGGALTLASGRVIENHSDCSVVYAASGTLRMTGAVCQSKGNGLWVDSGVTVQLFGGAINVPSGKIALRYGSKAVKDMLAAGCALQVNGGNWISLTELDQEKLNGGNYTVGACDSTETVSQSNGDGTHTLGGCPYCGAGAVVGPHTFSEGSYTCKDCNTPMVVKVEADGTATYYEDINAAWDALPTGKSSVTVLAGISHEERLEVGSGQDVTVNMLDGVTLTHNAKNSNIRNSCFYVNGGVLTLESGTVVDTGTSNYSHYAMYIEKGQLYVKGGTYTSAGNRYGSCVYASYSTNPMIRLTGGTLSGTSHVLYWRNDAGMVKTMLAEGYALKSGETFITLDTLNTYQFNSGSPCTVVECPHGSSTCSSNLDGTHTMGACTYCGLSEGKAEPHTLKEGDNVCADCGATMVAEVAVNGAPTYYEDINRAWASLKYKTGTITLLQNARPQSRLVVESGMDVTVKMNDGVTLTNSNPFTCFDIAGGTLRLDESCTVNQTGGRGFYIVYASNGKLYVNGGTYRSNGNGLQVLDGTVRISAGTTIEVEGTALYDYFNPVRNMLANDGLVLLNNETNKRVPYKTTGEKTLPAGNYTIIECKHDDMTAGDYFYTNNNNGTHTKFCTYCNKSLATESHDYSGSSCAACGLPYAARVTRTDDGGVTAYATIEEAWAAAKEAKKATVLLLNNLERAEALEVGSGMNVTVEMDEGVTYTTTGGNCFHVSGGTLNLTGSCTVVKGGGNSANSIVDIQSGTLNVTGGTYTSDWDGFSASSAVGTTICLTGGHITAANRTLRYNSTGGQVKTMLGDGYRLYDTQNNTKVKADTLEAQELRGCYRVESCDHGEYSAYVSNKNGTHNGICAYCGDNKTEGRCRYGAGTNGTATCQDCKSELTVTVNDGGVVYDGTAKTPDVTVAVDGETLPAEAYSLEYSGNTNAGAGTASVTVTGKAFDGTCMQTFSIAKASLTIKAGDQTITYGGSITEDAAHVASTGLCSGDGISTITLTASTGNVPGGTITPSAARIQNGSGADVTANYNITYEPGTLTITKAAGILTVPETTVNKIFGDPEFALSCSTNGDGRISYASSDGNVASVSADGNVLVKGAGEAAITVSLAEGTNHTGGAKETITIKVAKKGGFKPPQVNRSHLYERENTGTVDLAVLLPADCGEAAYGTPGRTGALSYKTEPEVEGSRLSYTLESGKINDKGTITITVATRNYEDITITVNIKLTDKIPVSLKEGTEVTLRNNTLTYGEPLSKLLFNETEFIGDDGKTVAGTLAWKDAAAKPDAGTPSAAWVFIPDDDAYITLEREVAITVNQAAPIITAAPSAVNRIYNPAKALEKGELNGGEAAGVDHGPLQGTWDWKHPNTVPAVNNSGYMAVFTPEDTKNYTTAETNVTVNVEKAVPYIAVPPSASAVTYGDNLAISTLTGGSAQYGDGKGKPGTGTDSAAAVAGSFAWKDKDVKPSVADSGKTEYAIIFTPENTQNYSPAETALTLTVNKAEKAPDMPPAVMNVSNSVEKVGSVPLPEGWEWQEPDRDKALEPDTAVTAVAVYNGADKGNYINETVTVVITRSACEHTAGGILYTGAGEKAPSCTEDGLGHRECTKCHAVLEKDITVPALGHDYNEGEVTKEPTVESEGEKTYTCRRCGHTYTEAVPKKIPQGLWIDGLQPSVPYTGYAIRQEGIRVYYGDTPLRENTDYAISYKNNTNAGDAQIIVTGKGNYTGKAVRTYTIEPADIGTDSGITAIVTTVTETGKKLKPAAAVTWNGKKLKENTDYTLSYNTDIKTAGDYDITITGKRNYTGTIVKVFHVKPKGTKLLNSAKVAGIKKSYPYQGGTLESDLQDITVKIGKTTLAKGTDYTVRTENTQAVGTAAVIIEAPPESAYAGEKRIPIVITGTDLRKGSIKGVEKSYPYTGVPVTPQITVYSGKNGSGEMIPADAYTVTYSGNINKGKADVTATGIPAKGYSGSVKVSYQIGRLDLWTEKAAGNIKVTMPAVINHAKGGAKPQPVVTYTNNGTTRTLREGADYTLIYSNNMTAAGTKTPTVKIAGTGNYSGSITENYTVSAQDIGRLSLTVTDRAYGKNKKGSYYHSAPKVYDLDGKQLKSGKDYTVQYTYADSGEPVGRNDKIEAGTKLCATVTAAAKSSYTGTQSVTYLVREAKEVKDIAKARNDKIAPQQYTGSAVTPGVRLYIQNGKTKNYLTDEDYEVIGWYNNTKRGTATILVRGKGAYSGVKCIKFKIVQKNIK